MQDKRECFCNTNGQCSNCGRCCADMLPLTKKDIQIVKSYVKNNKIKPFAIDLLDPMRCPFRDAVNKKCIIYEKRPTICRNFICNKEPTPQDAFIYDGDVMIQSLRKAIFNDDKQEKMFEKMFCSALEQMFGGKNERN